MTRKRTLKIYTANIDGENYVGVKAHSRKEAAEAYGRGPSVFRDGYIWELDQCADAISFPDVVGKAFYKPISARDYAWRETPYRRRRIEGTWNTYYD